MRTAITLGKKKTDKNFRLLAGPEVAIREQLDALKTGKYSDLDEVQVWSSARGIVKKIRPSDPRGILNEAALLPVGEQASSDTDASKDEDPTPDEDPSPEEQPIKNTAPSSQLPTPNS